MAASYLEMIAKLQEQGLEALKEAQKTHIETLSSVREFVAKLPNVPQLPKLEGVPSVAQLTELNLEFVEKVVDQQKSYATKLAAIFAPLDKTPVS
jgi:hypothetical protein